MIQPLTECPPSPNPRTRWRLHRHAEKMEALYQPEVVVALRAEHNVRTAQMYSAAGLPCPRMNFDHLPNKPRRAPRLPPPPASNPTAHPTRRKRGAGSSLNMPTAQLRPCGTPRRACWQPPPLVAVPVAVPAVPVAVPVAVRAVSVAVPASAPNRLNQQRPQRGDMIQSILRSHCQ